MESIPDPESGVVGGAKGCGNCALYCVISIAFLFVYLMLSYGGGYFAGSMMYMIFFLVLLIVGIIWGTKDRFRN